MATVAGTIYLNGCNYQLQYDILGQSVENNTTTVRLYGVLNVTNNYVSWSRSSRVWVHYIESSSFGTYYSKGSHVLIQGDWTFTHNTNGELTQNIGYGISTTFINGVSSVDITFPTIPRYAKITNAIGNFNDEQTPWFDYSNPANSTMSCWLEINPASEHLCTRTLSGTSGTYTWSLTEEEKNQLRAKLPNNNTGTIRIGLYSTIGGNTQASYIDRTFSIVNANPTFSNFTFEDTNPATLTLTGNNQYNVNGYSNIKATISTTNKATAKKSATMSKYRFVIGSNSVDINYSSSQEVSGTINKATNGTYNVYAIDSRNNSTLVTKLASKVIPYENIYINPNESIIERNDNRVGDNAILTLKGTFWNDSFGSVTNTIKSVTYRLRKTDSSTWINGETTITPTISGNNFTFTGEIASDNQDTTWDLESSYYIEVTITDELSTSIKGFTLNSAIPTMSLDKNGVGIMCAYDSNLGGKLQVGGNPVDIDKYSTDEQRIGTWIDGKPIYRKYLSFNLSTTIIYNDYKHNISDIDYIIKVEGSAYDGHEFYIMPAALPSDNVAKYGVAIQSITKTEVHIYSGTENKASNINVKMFVYYTKTKD